MAVLAQMGGGGAVRGDHRFDDRVGCHLGRRNHSGHDRGGGDPGRRTRQRSMAASDPLVERADALQYQFDSGPCLTAWRDQVTVRVDDTDGGDPVAAADGCGR